MPQTRRKIDWKRTIKIKNEGAAAMGRLGGLKGGKARAVKLSPRRRKQIAKKAAIARWSKKIKQ